MLGLVNVLERRRLIARSALLLGLSACGGQEFTQAAGGSGATAGTDAGGQGTGGTAGAPSGGQGGEASGGAAAGAGGTGGAATCRCKAGQYCREGSTDCFTCAELSRLRFAPPERLGTLSDSGRNARHPRVGSSGSDLFYSFEGVGLRYTTDASTSAGSPVKSTQPDDQGPLLLTDGGLTVGDVMGANFLFDRRQNGRRQIYVGRWDGGLEEVSPAPAPFNGGANDYSMAVAMTPSGETSPRAFWMTDRGMLGALLVTALPSDEAEAPVVLELGSKGCALAAPIDSQDDLTPWVTPDGKTLLVSYTGLDATCQPTDRGKDLYTAPLQPSSGQPTLPATLLSDVNSPKDEVDPSFSHDMCDLYFASNRDGDSYALYRARRR
jgi:hypothetical protein